MNKYQIEELRKQAADEMKAAMILTLTTDKTVLLAAQSWLLEYLIGKISNLKLEDREIDLEP